jgi:hypothetical protein
VSNSRSGWPANTYRDKTCRDMPDFHPEFGLLCPSPRRRRALRLAPVAVLAALAVGATMGLAVAHRTDADAPAATSLTVEEQLPVRPFDISANSPQHMRAQASCQAGTGEDLEALFFNPSCGPRKSHAKHGARATSRVEATVAGRTVRRGARRSRGDTFSNLGLKDARGGPWIRTARFQ